MDREEAHAGGRVALRGAEWTAAALILVGAGLLQCVGIRKPFFADDYLFLEQVRGRSLPAALLSADPLGNFVRPVSRQLYFWILSRAGGESPVVFHAVNLAIFLASLLALHAIVRRMLGRVPAAMALAFVAFHYAADVPLRWASGSQDLLAVLFATLCVQLQAKGRWVLAALSLLLALLSKEVVAGAAFVAIIASHAAGGSWRDALRRGTGLIGVTVAWGAWWLFSMSRRPMAAHGLAPGAGNALAAFVHLPQVALACEVRLGGQALGHWSVLAVLPAALAGVAVWLAGRGDGDEAPTSDGRAGKPGAQALGVGGAWALGATAPLVLVAPIWSAYFYLWALFGAGILIAALGRHLNSAWRIALVAALVFCSDNARRLDEFAAVGGAWTWQSHVDRHYVDRALGIVERYLRELRAARPTLPHRSTVFFANVAVSSGWQAADGPLLRWAYRDSSLRSYFRGQFTRARAERGPLYFFAVEHDSLKDRTNDPALLRSFAFSLLLAERPQSAIDALEVADGLGRGGAEFHYWRGLARWALADTLGAKRDLGECGFVPARGLPPGAEAAWNAAARDTAARLATLMRLRQRAALNAWVHARLAASLLAMGRQGEGAIEAYAYRVLAPDDPDAWRKWASAQLAKEQYEPALASLTRYLELSGRRGQMDMEAQQTAESLRRLLHGDVAQMARR